MTKVPATPDAISNRFPAGGSACHPARIVLCRAVGRMAGCGVLAGIILGMSGPDDAFARSPLRPVIAFSCADLPDDPRGQALCAALATQLGAQPGGAVLRRMDDLSRAPAAPGDLAVALHLKAADATGLSAYLSWSHGDAAPRTTGPIKDPIKDSVEVPVKGPVRRLDLPDAAPRPDTLRAFVQALLTTRPGPFDRN